MLQTESGLGELTEHFGIILGTERYDECLEFYRDVLGLPVWFEKDGLCCLRFGAGYLMIETGGMARSDRKANSENPTMLRFNVWDVEGVAKLLRARGVEVELKTFEWGVVGTFIDPDGNTCELKNADDPFFVEQSES